MPAPVDILCIVGTRPEVIKMAPVIRALREQQALGVSVLCSGQHRDLLAPLLDWFGIAPDADLEVMTDNQTLGMLTSRLLAALEQCLAAERPRLVIAQGDTTTVMCAALACFYPAIPFAHVEAGLRTFNLHYPFPEEFNRVAVGRVAQLHFCPTRRAADNVLREGAAADSVHLTGNTVIDALQVTVAKLGPPSAQTGQHVLLTAHRRENFGAPLENIFRAVLELCRQFPDMMVTYPVHPNRNVREPAYRLLGNHPQVRLVAPLNYPDLVAAMRISRFILTDSGGIQEEAPALGVPVLVLRNETERPEAVEAGVAKLVGSATHVIVGEWRRLMLEPEHYRRMSAGGSPYGDGAAAARICAAVTQVLREP